VSTTYGATGLGQTAASTRCVSSFFKEILGVRFRKGANARGLRATLCALSDRELMDVGTTRSEIDLRSPRTEVQTREASDPPINV